MAVLGSSADPRSRSYLDRRATVLGALADLERALDAARDGGGERAATRHHARGKLLARERIELLVDRDAPLLELSPVAGWGTDTPVGAAVVTALGVVKGHPCMLVANDPTVRGGAADPLTLRKVERAARIALDQRLPTIALVEAEGLAPTDPTELFQRTAATLGGLAALTAARIPTIGVFFGPPGHEADAGCFESTVALRGHPTAGHSEQVAEDERDALRLARACVARLPAPTGGPAPAAPPKRDPEDLVAIWPTDVDEILSRILDGSEFDEVQPERGPEVCAGWGRVHGHLVGVIAETTGPVRPLESRKACRLLRQAEATQTPVILLRQGLAHPHRAETAMAAAAAEVPLITVRIGGWCGVPLLDAGARFRFAWPDTWASLSPTEPEASALALSGRLDDDGLIDPRDTRTVLGFCLALIALARERQGAGGGA